MRKNFFVKLIFFLTPLFILGCHFSNDFVKPIVRPSPLVLSPKEPDLEETGVSEVIDGDTIKINDGRLVRYIGIDAPERGQKDFERCRDLNSELVWGKSIVLEFDQERKDQYDRILAYVKLKEGENEIFVNQEMILNGCAKSLPVEPNTKYTREFSEAEQKYKSKWQALPKGKYLKVPHYYQKDVPRYGSEACGPTSLKMILEFKKQIGELDKDVPTILKLTEILSPQKSRWSDGDRFFIPGFGVDDTPLARLAASKFGQTDSFVFGKSFHPPYPPTPAIDPKHKRQLMDTSDWQAPIDKDGWNLDKLYNEVIKGNPVIVDVTTDLNPEKGINDPRTYVPYYDQNGKKHWEVASGHFMVVIGFINYGELSQEIILLDPLKRRTGRPDNILIYPIERFLASWELLNYQGVVIK